MQLTICKSVVTNLQAPSKFWVSAVVPQPGGTKSKLEYLIVRVLSNKLWNWKLANL